VHSVLHTPLYFICLQRSFYQRLTNDKKSEVFFKVFFDYIRKAQQEIKTTGPVNTAETTAADKTAEDSKETGKDENRKKGN